MGTSLQSYLLRDKRRPKQNIPNLWFESIPQLQEMTPQAHSQSHNSGGEWKKSYQKRRGRILVVVHEVTEKIWS